MIDLIEERAPDFPLRNAERCMTRQAWGLALAQIEDKLLAHDIFHEDIVAKAYGAADALLPKDEDGNRLPFGIHIAARNPKREKE